MTQESSSTIEQFETHRVRVTYAMPPVELLRPLEKNFRMLRRMYEMYAAERPWMLHPTCAGVDVHVDWSLLGIFLLVTVSLGAFVFPAWHANWSPLLSWRTAILRGAGLLRAHSRA